MLLRSVRSLAITIALAGAVVPLAACSGSSTVGEPSSTATGTTTAPLTVSVHGPAKRIAEALGQVPLRADQRSAIEQLAKDHETRIAPVVKARADLANAIADQVQAGTIDRAALQPKIDALTAAHQAAQPGDRAAFEKLHDLLTSDQRAAFVTAMQSHAGDHEHGRRDGMRGRMQKWAADIGLTQAQQDQIKDKIRARWEAHVAGAAVGTDEQKTGAIQDGAMLAHGHAMHQQMKAVLEAFKGDKFSMDQVAPITNDKPMAQEFAGHMLGMLETSLPILTPDQRAKAAQKLKDRASKLDEEEETPAVQTAPAAQP